MVKKKQLDLPKFDHHNIDIISSEESFNNFMQGTIYKDFINELSIRIAQLQELLEDTDLDYTGRHYDLFRGGILCLRQMKDIFNCLKDNKNIQLLNIKETPNEN